MSLLSLISGVRGESVSNALVMLFAYGGLSWVDNDYGLWIINKEQGLQRTDANAADIDGDGTRDHEQPETGLARSARSESDDLAAGMRPAC